MNKKVHVNYNMANRAQGKAHHKKRKETYSYLYNLSTQFPLTQSALLHKSIFVSHLFPPNPLGHSQVKSLMRSVQLPPSKHGNSAQSSILTSHKGPSQPSGQMQPKRPYTKKQNCTQMSTCFFVNRKLTCW